MNNYILFVHPRVLQTSEDCLYLNIFTPLSASPLSNLAVMVFIHGGDFIHLDAGSPMFNGEILVNRSNVILVNINYRLGESRNPARGIPLLDCSVVCNRNSHFTGNRKLVWHTVRLIEERGYGDLSMDTMHQKDPLVLFGYEAF